MKYRSSFVFMSLCLMLAGCGQSLNDDPTDVAGETSISGKLQLTTVSKVASRAKTVLEDYMILAQSEATGTIYRGTTDGEGVFEIDIPDSEAGNTFMITILGDDGQAIGPVLFGTAGEDGITGLTVDGEASLGTIELPVDPTQAPIEPGNDGNVDGDEDPDLTTRLNDDGAPLGLATNGKGDEANAEGDIDPNDIVDKDHDGLIDILDADDNGNGTIDDFDGDGDVGGELTDLIINFFMNLKISAGEAAVPYYSGTDVERSEALETDYLITLEAMTTDSSTRTITAINGLETPGPSYLASATAVSAGGNVLWSSISYAFAEKADRFDVFLCPNDVMTPGDTFTIEITFDDGTTEVYSRMINYIFMNIPKLQKYGSAGSLTDFDMTSETIDGTPGKPIPFDGSQNLTLEFNPPPDETGAYMTALEYHFEIFLLDADDNQLGNQLLYQAPPSDVSTLSADNTFTVTIPAEFFPNTVTVDSVDKAVAAYKIDITAQCPSGNCAIMLNFQKQ